MHLENRRKKNSPDREEFLSDSKKGTWCFTELVKDKTKQQQNGAGRKQLQQGTGIFN